MDMHGPEATFWEDLEFKITECIRNTLDRRIQFYEEEIRKLSEQRFKPVWSFCNFFILKVPKIIYLLNPSIDFIFLGFFFKLLLKI